MPGIAEIEIAGRRARRPPDRFGKCRFQRHLDRAVQPVIGNEIAVAILARFVEPGERADQLVVAAPDRDRWMRRQAFCLIIHLCRDILQEIRGRGIEVAGKHEVLPDHEPEPVAEIVEPVRLVEAAAPDPDHVHVGVHCRGQQILDALWRHP
ncbi:hypothetical protein D9M72_534570 [compost metagenome]